VNVIHTTLKIMKKLKLLYHTFLPHIPYGILKLLVFPIHNLQKQFYHFLVSIEVLQFKVLNMPYFLVIDITLSV